MSFISPSSEINDGDGVDIGKKHKLGHLRVDDQGNATFKRLPTNQLVEALQLGIQYAVGGLETRPARDVLYQDFLKVEIIHFPKEGRQTPRATPAHRFNDFTIRSYAPVAFRHFREKFNIRPEDFLSSICKPLRELKNPGASGSLFYLTSDDDFILKTVQKREADFLKTLLPGYYMNVTQNPRTLLPKFFGLYCYQGDNKNIRITVMNNLIPSHVQIHEKYDLKGSTYKRCASHEEKQKDSPTWKDLDFMERHPQGFLLDSQTYNALKNTVERDCRVLESFRIMDYSFLIGVHQVDPLSESTSSGSLQNKSRKLLYSTPMDNIQAEFNEMNKPDEQLAKTGGIPARDEAGGQLLLYVGIIDILQSYQLRKKLEHTFKSVMTDGNQISVTNPSFYSERFQKFLFTTVFRRAAGQSDSPSRRSAKFSRPIPDPNFAVTIDDIDRIRPSSNPTSYYSSLRSKGESEITNETNSSTTINVSSYRSDSLFNQPTKRNSALIQTTSFRQNINEQARTEFYRNLSKNEQRSSSRKEISSNSNVRYPSADRTTRL